MDKIGLPGEKAAIITGKRQSLTPQSMPGTRC
jgi:hypothetical protein